MSNGTDLKPHKDIVNGDARTYKRFADDYDKYSAEFNWRGPESVLSVWLKYHSSVPVKHRVFDAGCGTGLVGEKIQELPNTSMIEVYGGDLSPDMIAVAKSKNISVYSDFRVVNLKEPLPYESGSFDSIISSGTFLQGHCGPECLANIMKVLKEGGYFIVTVRVSYYSETKTEWDRKSLDCNCKLLEDIRVPYSDAADGAVLVFQKDIGGTA